MNRSSVSSQLQHQNGRPFRVVWIVLHHDGSWQTGEDFIHEYLIGHEFVVAMFGDANFLSSHQFLNSAKRFAHGAGQATGWKQDSQRRILPLASSAHLRILADFSKDSGRNGR